MADDKNKEPMNVDEPDQTPQIPAADEDTKALLDTLKGLDLDTPEAIQNMAHASSQTAY